MATTHDHTRRETHTVYIIKSLRVCCSVHAKPHNARATEHIALKISARIRTDRMDYVHNYSAHAVAVQITANVFIWSRRRPEKNNLSPNDQTHTHAYNRLGKTKRGFQ